MSFEDVSEFCLDASNRRRWVYRWLRVPESREPAKVRVVLELLDECKSLSLKVLLARVLDYENST